MYPGQMDFFLNQYEEAVKRPFDYLLIDLKTTTQDNCRLRTNVLPTEEGFNQAANSFACPASSSYQGPRSGFSSGRANANALA